MKKSAFILGLVFYVLASPLLPLDARAEGSNHANVWATEFYRMVYRGNAYSDRRKNQNDIGEILYTTSETAPGLFFTCLAGKLRVGVGFKPQDLYTALSGTKTYGVSGEGNFVPDEKMLSYIDMTLDDGPKIGLGRWLYYKDRETAQSRKRVPAAKLYNAVVREQTVTVFAKRKQALLDIPRPNAAFADFGAECGLGRNAKP